MEARPRLGLAEALLDDGDEGVSDDRHAEEHKCTFDYKSHGASLLSTTMVRCIADSLPDRV
jgi:hypothetical protein